MTLRVTFWERSQGKSWSGVSFVKLCFVSIFFELQVGWLVGLKGFGVVFGCVGAEWVGGWFVEFFGAGHPVSGCCFPIFHFCSSTD